MYRGRQRGARRRRYFNVCEQYGSSSQDDDNQSQIYQRPRTGRHHGEDNQSQGYQRPSRGRHPPGLKGKEIGLWYARQNSGGRKRMERNLPSLSLDSKQTRLIDDALSDLSGGIERETKFASHSSMIRNQGEFSLADCRNDVASLSSKVSIKTEPSSHIGDEFNQLIEDLSQRNFEEIKKEIKQEPEDSFCVCNSSLEDNLEEFDDSFSENLNNIEDSKFKRAYTANVLANQNRDKKGLNALSDDIFEVLAQNHSLDHKLWEEMREKQNLPKYQEMMKFRSRLPSYNKNNEILDLIRKNQFLVLSGETGCGKTTQVSQFILDDCIERKEASTCRIICTQPRRISAISVAQRVADERAEPLGKSVGYQIRLEHSLPRKAGSILFCTTGIVLKWLQGDPTLSTVSHLILDEIHERDMLSDFLLCIAKDLIVLRPDLKVILMSATLNAEQFSQYYGNCPMIHIPGFTFPVKEFYLEDIIEFTKYKFSMPKQGRRFHFYKDKEEPSFDAMISPYVRELQKDGSYSEATLHQLVNPQSEEMDMDFILQLLRYIHKQPPGAVLVFVPGWAQISSLHKLIEKDYILGGSSCLVMPLHSLMPTISQRAVFDRPKHGVRKIVLATNIAETSITIDDIVYVVDCGKIKLRNYDKKSDVSTLLPEWVALANAKQRKGRAGRVQEGICYHLYTKARESQFMDYQLPELLRTRLEEIILQVKILHLGLCKPFLSKVMEPPDEKVIDCSLQMLHVINALDAKENLTPLGFHLARLPMHPLTGKMLLMGAIFSCLDPILTVAASLSFKDPFIIPLGKENLVDKQKARIDDGRNSDHLVLVSVYDGWVNASRQNRDKSYAWENFLSTSILEQLKRMRKQFLDMLRESNFINSINSTTHELNRNSKNLPLVKAIITAGLYPNVARILVNDSGMRKSIVLKDSKVKLHPKSVNDKVRYFQGSWMVFWDKIKSSQVFLHDTTTVMNYPLLFFGQRLEYDVQNNCFNVDDFVKIRCEKDVARAIKELRNQLDTLLEHKITHPGPTQWDRQTKEGLLLNTIVDLISSEVHRPSTGKYP